MYITYYLFTFFFILPLYTFIARETVNPTERYKFVQSFILSLRNSFHFYFYLYSVSNFASLLFSIRWGSRFFSLSLVILLLLMPLSCTMFICLKHKRLFVVVVMVWLFLCALSQLFYLLLCVCVSFFLSP